MLKPWMKAWGLVAAVCVSLPLTILAVDEISSRMKVKARDDALEWMVQASKTMMNTQSKIIAVLSTRKNAKTRAEVREANNELKMLEAEYNAYAIRWNWLMDEHGIAFKALADSKTPEEVANETRRRNDYSKWRTEPKDPMR